jgi:hypothetical protein
MKNTHSQCSTCSIRGYSNDICKLHYKTMSKEGCVHHTENQPQEECSWKSLGKKAAIGAGIGIAGTCAGLAVLPALGLKALLGHTLATTVSSAGGALGAGTNVAIHRRKKCSNVIKKKKRSVLLPNVRRIRDE